MALPLLNKWGYPEREVMGWTLDRFNAIVNNIEELDARERISGMEDLRMSVAGLLSKDANRSFAVYRRDVMRLPVAERAREIVRKSS